MDKIIKALIGLIFAFIALVGIFGILPQLGLESPFANFQNPLAGLFEQGKNAAANAALDATGLKSKAKAALEGNRDKIAPAPRPPPPAAPAAHPPPPHASREVTRLPAGAPEPGTSSISYGGTDATVTTYDDPGVVTVNAMGQDVTLAVPDSAQDYLPFLGYLG